MASRRYVRRWGALSLAVGAVLVGAAARSPAGPDPLAAGTAPESTTVVSVDGCDTGGLCTAPRHTVALTAGTSAGRALTGHPVTLVAGATGPVSLLLRTPGRFADVTVTDRRGRRVAGAVGADGTRWTSATALAAGGRYTARLVVERPRDGAGPEAPRRHLARLVLRTPVAPGGERLTVTFGPAGGRTYGVGRPVTAELSQPVPADSPVTRRLVERGLRVRTEPRVEGSWHWVDPTTLHYRPRHYWPAHATVHVHSALDGRHIGGDLYGGRSRPLTLTTGDRVEAVTDVSALKMTVFRDGRAIRTIPVTTGKPATGPEAVSRSSSARSRSSVCGATPSASRAAAATTTTSRSVGPPG